MPASRGGPLTVVHFNLPCEPAETGLLLAQRYATLSSLAEKQAAAGARVQVLQRFDRDETVAHNGVQYEFRREADRDRHGRAWTVSRRLTALARQHSPAVVHLHGLAFAAQARALRIVLPAQSAVVVQDHGTKPWGVRRLRAIRRALLAGADGVFLNAHEMAPPLRDAGVLPPAMPCYAVGEASSSFRRIPQAEARERIGLTGSPLVLWVGRLQRIKDPLTAVDGFCRAAHAHAGARLAMIYQESALLAAVREVVAGHGLADRVTFVGAVEHPKLELYYSSADIFVTAGHWEGSNYALIEAMACGVWPVCSSNPSHRGMLGGEAGDLFDVGDPESCRRALEAACAAAAVMPGERAARVLARFERALSWDAIVRQSFAAYEAVLASRGRPSNQVE